MDFLFAKIYNREFGYFDSCCFGCWICDVSVDWCAYIQNVWKLKSPLGVWSIWDENYY